MVCVDELLQSIAEQATSLNKNVVDAMEAYRKENDTLRKKNQALQSALLAKAVGGVETTSDEQGSVKPIAFVEHLTSDVIKLTVADREFNIHRSILQSIPFFDAKLANWSDEVVQLPEPITETAFHILLKRMYLGISLPAGEPALCAQMLSLAKYWLMDDIVLEMIAELLRTARKEDIPVLGSLADSFDLPELSAAIEKLQRTALCSAKDLETLVQQALKGDRQAQKLSTATLEIHPEAAAVLRKQFETCDFFTWSTEQTKNYNIPKTVHAVRVRESFQWFWMEVKKAKLLETDLPFMSKMLIPRLDMRTGYTRNQHWGHTCRPEIDQDTTPTTLATALMASGGIGCTFSDALTDMVNAASNHLRTRHLLSADLKELLTLMPKALFDYSCDFDEAVAKMIKSLPLATGIEIFCLLRDRIGNVGSRTAAALQELGQI